MHICVLGFAHSISASRVYTKEAFSLRDAGHRVTLIARDVRVTEGYDEAVFGKARSGIRDGIAHTLFPHRPKSAFRRLLAEPVLLCRYLAAVWRVKADVYHCHEPQSLVVAFLIAPLRRARVVYDCHEYQPESTSEFFGPLYPIVFPICRGLERVAARICSAVVTVNEELGDRFRKDSRLVAVLPNYPLRASFEAESDVTSPQLEHYVGKKVLVYHGSLSRPRGLLSCIQLIDGIRQNIPEAVLLIIGPPSAPEFMTELKEMAEPLRDAVEFFPWMEHDELVAYLRRADLGLFLPDPALERYQKAEPVKYFEYAACRVPVVMSDVPALRTLVEVNENGRVVDPRDMKHACAEVVCLLQDSARLALMAEKGRKAFIDRLSWEAVQDRLLAIYRTFESESASAEDTA
jgi:glycosyltransferase involved in cell wall biosynthesis